jgi:hypothetical protein
MVSYNKNFVVSFSSNDTSGISSVMNSNIKSDIMDIMILLNNSDSYDNAVKQKIQYIQNYIYGNMKIIDYMIMLYGLDSVMQEYQNRFGTIVWSPIITIDFATIILDNIIIIHEAIRQPDNVTLNENNKELSTLALSMSAFNNSQITTPRPPSISSQPSLEVDDYNDY